MKRKKGIDVAEKVIMIHVNGVTDEEKGSIQRKYPNAVVRVLHFNETTTEAITYKKKVNYVVYMPEISAQQAAEVSDMWPGSRIVSFRTH